MTPKGKILAVDDESGITEFVQYILQNAGFSVKTAAGGWEAWDLIASEPFDFVISDIRMDKGDGVELAEKIREMPEPKPKIALMSAYTDIPLSDVHARGAVALIQKPAHSETLIQTVKHALVPSAQHWAASESLTLTGPEKLRAQFASFADALKSGALQPGFGGMFVSCTGPLPFVDTVVAFDLMFATGEPTCLQGVGLVRWVRSKAARSFFPGFGLEILRLDPGSMATIQMYIETTKPESFIPIGQIPSALP